MFSRVIRRFRPLIHRTSSHRYASAAVAHRTHFPQTSNHYHILPPIYYSVHRFKKTSSNKHDDEDETWREDPSLSRDSKVVKFVAPSLRMDLVLKSALGIARNKIEKLFYESRVRVNGKKVLKKSVTICEGDEIDVIRRVSSTNPEHIYVSRVEVLSTAPAEDEGIHIHARRFKSLLIDNYQQNPYKPSSADEDKN